MHRAECGETKVSGCAQNRVWGDKGGVCVHRTECGVTKVGLP